MDNSPQKPQIILNGHYAVEPEAPSKEGYTLARWKAVLDSDALYSFENTPITDKISIYATWTPANSGDKFSDGEDQQPGDGENKPGDGQQSGDSENKPGGDEQQPGDGEQQPSGGDNQPPGDGENKPGDGNEQPPSGDGENKLDEGGGQKPENEN